MAEFRFCPELFEIRALVQERLTDRGFEWFSHYSAVDLLHDTFGIEVCGIRERDDAVAIQRVLCRMFPDWSAG